MGLGHSPRIVTDGLVLALDAQNSKSWKSGTTWTDTIGGNNGTLTGGTSHSDGPFPEAGYVEFDGSTEYLSIADDASLDMGSSNFTIEGWYFPLGNANVSTAIFSKRPNSSTVGGVLIYYGSTGLTPTLLVDIGGSWAINITSSVSFVANQWNHFAATRNGSAFNLYINGVSGGSASNAGSIPDNSSAFVIGAMGADGSGTISSCYISNFRVVKGTALYTSDFTPPSSPLTAVTNTTLLCCQGGTNVDASPSAHTFQVIIGVPTLTSVGPSATKYFEFDGVDDYATLSSSQIAPGTGAFTWNFWAKHIPTAETGVGTKSVLFSGTGSNTTYGGVYMDSLTYGVFYYATGYRIADYDTAFNDQWWHIAFVGNGGASGSRTLKLYRNGVQAGSTYTYDYNFTSTTPYIGRNHSYAPESMRGFISNATYYNRELTASEIQQNYNALKGRYA
jgi:hypothetical protein